jgi:hypothetical protein
MFELRGARSWVRFVLCVVSMLGLSAVSSAIAADVRFASGTNALKIPFKLYNNHMIVEVPPKRGVE